MAATGTEHPTLAQLKSFFDYIKSYFCKQSDYTALKQQVDGITPSEPYTLPTASSSVKGGIKVGTGLSMSGDTLNNTITKYTLPTASASTLGGVKVGSGLSISGGVLSASGASFSKTSIKSSGSGFTAYRWGDVCVVHVEASSVSGSTTLGKVQSAYAPSAAIVGTCVSAASNPNVAGFIKVDTSGNVIVNMVQSGTHAPSGSVMWIA